ncbi:putative MFS-type transporter C18.02 [Erysiphe neolycopersici]|uniref:Putative MFS-type transporter C18.02 n=1 Tax=Erysiphe neolycopersici TaxID=212602 RepID=A0A420HRH2_9PEZI|nr:putative MFS-type transporter C18.02 [Erysiphe neolycopersici]
MPSKSSSPPFGIHWRSSSTFILGCVSIALFTDLFLYGIVVPLLPFILERRLHLPHSEIQEGISLLLAYYAGSSVISSIPVGYLTDNLPSCRLPFLIGLLSMFTSTLLLWLGQSWTILALARVFQGISASLVWTVSLTLVLSTVGNKRLGIALSSIFGFVSFGQLIAPVIGGVVYQHLGEGWVFSIGFILLFVDLVMRIFIVEKDAVKRNGWDKMSAPLPDDVVTSSETSPLISNENDSNADITKWKLPPNVSSWFSKFPILYLVATSPRILTSLLLCYTNAVTLAIFDATLPLQGLDLFSFSSRSTGLLFVPLVLPCIIISPVIGACVDRYGTKIPTVIGLLILTLPLILLSTVKAVPPGGEGYISEVAKFGTLLLVCGIGIASTGPESLIEQSYVIGNYEKSNPECFPHGAPYAQLYAITNMTFCLGLTLGPLVASFIKLNFGYIVMNYCLAAWCIIVSIVCLFFLGEKPQIWLKMSRREVQSSG